MSDLRTAALRALEALEALRLGMPDSVLTRSLDQRIDALRAALAIIQPEIKDDKPFGYFRAEPFGWTDCAPTDEGAIPLYERPQQPPTPPEAKTEAENIAYCAGWWAALQTVRAQVEINAALSRESISRTQTAWKMGYEVGKAEANGVLDLSPPPKDKPFKETT